MRKIGRKMDIEFLGRYHIHHRTQTTLRRGYHVTVFGSSLFFSKSAHDTTQKTVSAQPEEKAKAPTRPEG